MDPFFVRARKRTTNYSANCFRLRLASIDFPRFLPRLLLDCFFFGNSIGRSAFASERMTQPAFMPFAICHFVFFYIFADRLVLFVQFGELQWATFNYIGKVKKKRTLLFKKKWCCVTLVLYCRLERTAMELHVFYEGYILASFCRRRALYIQLVAASVQASPLQCAPASCEAF